MGWNTKMTGSGKNRATDLLALQRLLDSHGADRTRWPARERLRFAPLIAEDREARTLLREAEALDRLIDLSPRVSKVREEALAARIVARAVAEPRGAAVPSPVLRPVASQRATLATMRMPRAAMASWRAWPAAGLLAASLLVGVIVGGAGLASPAVQSIATVVGADGDGEGQQLAQVADPGFSDEDSL